MYQVYPTADASMAVVAGHVPDFDEAMVLFSGPHAQVMAQEFAAWKNLQARANMNRSSDARLRRGATAPRQVSADPARIPWKKLTTPARPIRRPAPHKSV